MPYENPPLSSTPPTNFNLTGEPGPYSSETPASVNKEASVPSSFSEAEPFCWKRKNECENFQSRTSCSLYCIGEEALGSSSKTEVFLPGNVLSSSDQNANRQSTEQNAPGSNQDELVECQYCSLFIPLQHMSKHINVSHPSASSSSSSSTLRRDRSKCDPIEPTIDANATPEPSVSLSMNLTSENGPHQQSNTAISTATENFLQPSVDTGAPYNQRESIELKTEASNPSSTPIQPLEPCRLCHLTFDTAEEAADHEMAHRLQAEEDEQLGSSDSENFYQVILNNFQRTLNTVVSTSSNNEDQNNDNNDDENNNNNNNNNPDHEMNNLSHNRNETNQSTQEHNALVMSFIPGRNLTIWTAASPRSDGDQSQSTLLPNGGYASLISPIALLTEQLVSGGSTLSLDEWITRLRFGDHTSDTQTSQTQNVTSQEIIDSLPIHTYINIPPTQHQTLDSLDVDPDVCMVCLDEYAAEDQLRQLPCSHYFHVRCIDAWLLRYRHQKHMSSCYESLPPTCCSFLHRSTLCPACKRSVVETTFHDKPSNESDTNFSEIH